MSAPLASRWVANECLNVWHVTAFLILACLEARLISLFSADLWCDDDAKGVY